MDLSKLPKIKGNKNKKIRVGRGYSSGYGGHTSGKGMKGQKSRSGNSIPFGFEGGQVPLYKKLPKIGGFRNPRSKDVAVVTFTRISEFTEGTTITPKLLVEQKILKVIPRNGVKILNRGKLEKKFTFEGFEYSNGAKAAIEASGGKIA